MWARVGQSTASGPTWEYNRRNLLSLMHSPWHEEKICAVASSRNSHSFLGTKLDRRVVAGMSIKFNASGFSRYTFASVRATRSQLSTVTLLIPASLATSLG